jgi:hypothetical protein
MPIEKQLQYFLQHHSLSSDTNNQQEDGDTLSDVDSGDGYKALRDQGKIDSYTVTLQINADGAKYFKTSKYSFWPLMAIVTEASYKDRRKFVILLAIWVGNKKPPKYAVMRGSIAKLKKLERDGFHYNGKLYKIRVLVITVDTIARSALTNTTQHNGDCGCDFCLHPGEQISKGRGTIRVYPQPDEEFDEENNLEHLTYSSRSLEQHLRDVKMAMESGQRINGVVGPNIFMDLPDFDFIKALVPDYLYSCCQGVFKSYIILFTSTVGENGKKEWYLGRKMKVINSGLIAAKPPYEITRTIECLDITSDWKASTFRTFQLYYFPILQDLLPQKYFMHYSNLSYGIYLLLQNRLSREDVLKAQILFEQLVIDMEKLYTKKSITINVHFLVHLCQSVFDWGCLWATSTFIPEWFNGEMMSMCNGTQHTGKQMAINFLINKRSTNQVDQNPGGAFQI